MKVADLFCGAGGMSLGLIAAGHDVVYAVDSWSVAVDHYSRNVGNHAVVGDIGSAALEIPDVDMVVGGPPCQDFSRANQTSKSGVSLLTIAFAEHICANKPTWFVMENVPDAIKFDEYQHALRIFADAGYDVSTTVYRMSRYGVPQLRRRLFAVGRLGGLPNTMRMWGPPETPVYSVREYFDNIGMALDIPHGESCYFAPPRGRNDKTVYSVDELARTIRSKNFGPSKGTPEHRGNPVSPHTVKPLTERQRAIIQTFPPDYDWQGSKTALNTMIGNAVPPAFAKALGGWILENAA